MPKRAHGTTAVARQSGRCQSVGLNGCTPRHLVPRGGRIRAALPPPVETTGYFVLSVAVANALKHSRAHELVVRLAQTDGALRIEVRDDGVGGGAPSRSGSGMRGMADRVDAIGGRLTVDSPVGHGTSVVAEVPCQS
jgi:signal transduction histidine kinase